METFVGVITFIILTVLTVVVSVVLLLLALLGIGFAIWCMLNELNTEPRYLIKLKSERHPQFGPFRTFAAEEGYIKVSLLPMLYASVGPLLEKFNAAVVSRLDRVEEWCGNAWRSQPAQLIARLSLTSTFLSGIFWGSAYLFGNEPAQVTSIGCAYYNWPLVEGFAISRMWDALLAPLAVLTFIGALWLTIRTVFGVETRGVFIHCLRRRAVIFAGIGLLLGLIAAPGLAESRSWWALAGFLPLMAIIIVIAATAVGVFVEVAESAKVFLWEYGCTNVFRQVNCYHAGAALFGVCAAGGVFGGLFWWGLPVGLAIGVGGGLLLGGFVTCCSYLLAFIVRLGLSVPRFLRWQFVAD